MVEIKEGMRVKVNQDMNVQEEEQLDYIGLTEVVIKVKNTRLPFPYLVKFSEEWLMEQELSFDRKELDIVNNNIRRI